MAGLYYVIFGAVYNATYFSQAGFSNCGVGCTSSGFSGTEVVFSMYPIWSPPSWNHVDYNATTCTISPSYTPQNPPPACLYPPADFSTNYSSNYGGAFLIVLAVVVLAVVVRVGDRTTPNPPTDNSAKSAVSSA
jgi:hypothetical protein